MKRSEINRLQIEALEFLKLHHFSLPAWATWRPKDWKKAGKTANEVKKRMLGWDITDFGKGEFGKLGVLLFTLRNGPSDGSGEPYCEKLLVLSRGQNLPTHFHWSKTEDIINRAGGKLTLRLWNSDKSEKPTRKTVKVRLDGGLWREIPAGADLEILPGGSITITPGIYHSFHVLDDDVLIGEVSSVNDDKKDNRFLEPMPRFSKIKEDVEILFYLCNEYP